MDYNAGALDWTMTDFERFQERLAAALFEIKPEPDGESVRVAVPFARLEEFATICRDHLSVPYNYVDVQYPAEARTVIVFGARTFVIGTDVENEAAKRWAIALGLPPPQADWPVSF